MDVVTKTRPASDIAEDIRKFLRSFDPVKQGVHQITFNVNEDGMVNLGGHVRGMVARRVLIDNIPDILGVNALDANELYDDETLRLTVGRVIPNGTLARVNYGRVMLYGLAPQDPEGTLKRVADVPGVVEVSTQFYA